MKKIKLSQNTKTILFLIGLLLTLPVISALFLTAVLLTQ